VLPPTVKVINQDLHHSVFGPSLFVIALKDERGRANGEYRYVTLKHLPKAQRLIKRAAVREVFSW
jgi:ERCC4-related helicase